MTDLSGITPEAPKRTIVVPSTDGPRCERCGGELPPLTEEMQAMARQAGGVELVHERCPGDPPAAPEGRYFEVRVQIVEVREADADTIPPYANGGGDQHPQVDELVSFKEGLRAPDLDRAMRPLALALGEKWAKAEKQAKVADLQPQPIPPD